MMMTNVFVRMVSALWTELGLEEPELDDNGHAVLRLKSYIVELYPSEDGRHVLAAVPVARLSEDQTQRRREADALLRLSLPSLLVNRGAICLGEKAHSDNVTVRGICPCDMGMLHRLSEMIADLIHLSDECIRTIALSSVGDSRAVRASAHPLTGEGLIFRP
ncbi:MAG: CesT family type III secretion system chaperone [Hyphomicrobiales bacterium]|nr:CesT family type III secretion system chaperone [Hyphomicrobiales bacterium]